MRLIDTDKLDIYDVSPAYGTCVMGATEEDIELAPTVDAIPIEWLKGKQDEHCNDGFAWIYEAVIDEWGKERI